MNKIYVIILIVAIIYLYSENKSVRESMANTEENLDDKIKNHVNNIYKADVEAIRNLANISKELQNGSLKIPGNLTVEGNIILNKDLTTKGNIILSKDLIAKGHINLSKNLNMVNGATITSTGRLHIAPQEVLYVLPKKGTRVTKDWGSTGHIAVHDLWVGQNLAVTDHIGCKRLDITSKVGTTHFNYANTGNNYIRGDLKDKLTKDGKDILKKGDQVRLNNINGHHPNKGIHMERGGHAISYLKGDLFSLL